MEDEDGAQRYITESACLPNDIILYIYVYMCVCVCLDLDEVCSGTQLSVSRPSCMSVQDVLVEATIASSFGHD